MCIKCYLLIIINLTYMCIIDIIICDDDHDDGSAGAGRAVVLML